MKVAAVFGGAGFIGRYVVRLLARRGYAVRVAGRNPNHAGFLRMAGDVGQVLPFFADLAQPASLTRCVAGADVVVNLLGILRESRRGAFGEVHAEGARQIARLAARFGAERMVHVSAIGADTGSRSRYAQSKADGEAAVHTAYPEACILRPSVVFGPEDGFFNLFAALMRFSPLAPVVAPATRMQPVYVGDVAQAVLAGLERPDTGGRVYELGGPEVLTMREIMARIQRIAGWRKPLLPMPEWATSLLAALPFSPLTRDQRILLRHDNVVTPGAFDLPALGIAPLPIDMVAPSYLRRFSPLPAGRLAFP